MARNVLIPPRVPLTDPRTGMISREWYRFLEQQTQTIAGVSGAPITRINDSNVTLTLSGSPSVAALAAVTLTLGWQGNLPINRGGTGAGTAEAARDAIIGYVPVNKAGDTMLGMLTLAADPVGDLDAATKRSVEAGDVATLASANDYTDAAVAGITGSSFSADDIVTVPDGDTFALVFTDDGNLVAVG